MCRRSWVLRSVTLVAFLMLLLGCAKGTDLEGEPTELSGEPGPDISLVDATTGDTKSNEPTPVTQADAAADASTAPEADPPPVLAPQPVLTKIVPDKGIAGSPGPMVVLTGSSFVAGSVVQLDGVALPTTLVSDTELRATFPTAKLAAVGVLHVSVKTGPPGGGMSADLTFAVENPAPSMVSLSPQSATKGSADVTLTATGAGFVSGATVTFAGADLVTTFVGAQALTAVIPSAKLAASGSFDVTVKNPAPGGGTSTPVAFTVTNPTVVVSSISPVGATAGAATTPLAIVGTGFIPTSAVTFNGAVVTSTYVDATHLSATLPASSLLVAGSFPVVVTNPAPGGGVSTPHMFLVQYATPVAASLAPSSVNAGAGPTPVTVTGSGFYAASQITFDNAPAATTYVDATHVRASLSAQQLSAAGNISVRVVNPAPGGGTSSALAFAVNSGIPTINLLSPPGRVLGSPDTIVTVTGTGFVAASVVQSNGANIATKFISSTQLTAIIPAAQLTQFATLSITVVNPAPGGGASTIRSFSVGCEAGGVDVALGAPGTTWNITLAFASAPTSSRINASGACPTTVTNTASPPYRAVVVQNSTAAPVTLSAWAVCTSGGHDDDAFMTFYRRATPPVSDTERLACVGSVSEGSGGVAGTTQFTSTEAGGSRYCPGLTLANGGGLSLASCEKAVVYIQAYSLTSNLYPPPATMRLRPE